MRSTRIIAFFTALATVIAALSILASCGGEKEPAFTVPTAPAVTQSEKAEASDSFSDTESESAATSPAETKAIETETSGGEILTPVDFSTIPLPGETGYTDHAFRKRSAVVGEDGVSRIADRIEADEGFENYPISVLLEYYYALAYLIKAAHADELAKEPETAAYVETVWKRAQGYRPVMFDAVSRGKSIFPMSQASDFAMETFSDKIGALVGLVYDCFTNYYDPTRTKPDGSIEYIRDRTDEYYQAIADFAAFFDSYYNKIGYSSVGTFFSLVNTQIQRYYQDGAAKHARSTEDIVRALNIPRSPYALTEYDSERMKTKVTIYSDGYDHCLFTSSSYASSGELSHVFYAKDVFWLDPAASASFNMRGESISRYVLYQNVSLYVGSKADMLPDRAAVIGNAALKSAVESFLGKTDPTVKNLTTIVGIEWTDETITLTDRKDNRKSYPSGGICRDTSVFDDFVSLSALSVDASGLPDDAFLRNCFLSLDDLTVMNCRASRLDLSRLTMLKNLVFRDCPELRGVYLGEGYRQFNRFEFSGEKNGYVHTLDLLSGALSFGTLDISALSIDDIGGFRGCGYIMNNTLILGDMYDVDFFLYYYELVTVRIYGTAPTDAEIEAKIFESKRNVYLLNYMRVYSGFTSERY